MSTHTQTPDAAFDAGERPIRELLASIPSLSVPLLEALLEVARMESYADRAPVIHEGERSDHLYIVAGGRIEVFRAARDRQDEQRIVSLGPGELLGELALIDGAPRSLSARADGACRLLRIVPEELARLPEGERLLADLKVALGSSVVKRMRERTDNYVAVLEQQLEKAREQQQFGHFFLFAMTVMAIGLVTNNLLLRHLVDIEPNSMEFAWVFGLILVLPCLVILRVMRIPLYHLGFKREGLRESLSEGATLSLAAAALTVALVQMGVLPGPAGPVFDPILVPAYAVHTFLQELFARGFFQSAIQRFLDDRRGLRSVLLTSVLFGLFHIHFGFGAVAATAIGGLLFGAFYLRHKNLAGVTLLHFVLGMCFFNSGLV